jgi:transposase
MGNKRSLPPEVQEWRRLRAWELYQRGWVQQDIADALGATKGAVSQWLAMARAHGPEALRAHPRPGTPSQLTAEQKWLIPDFLWHGAEAYGFRGEVWTCARVAKVIEREFGVRYSKSHVSRLLKELQWTPQMPITRAIQRDEAEVERWRTEVWPALYAAARRERRTPIFVDEAGFYLLPSLVRTYNPKGLRPQIDQVEGRDHLSVMSGVTPRGKLYTLVRDRSLTGFASVVFLEHLLRYARKWLVIWDGSPIHRGDEIKEFLASSAAKRIHLERLPGYAPDLNPDEGVWDHLKYVEMRNLACLNLVQLYRELEMAIARLRQKSHLIRSFFAGAKLAI